MIVFTILLAIAALPYGIALSYDEFCDGHYAASPSPTYTAEAQIYRTYDVLNLTMASLGVCLILDEFNDPARQIVSLDLDTFRAGSACGACMEVTEPETGNSVVLTVFEWHNGRGTHDIGVTQAISNELHGTVNYFPFEVKWRFVPCPSSIVSGNLKFRLSPDATLENTPSIKISNSPVGIMKVSIQREGLTHVLDRMVGNSAYWVLPQGMQVLPMRVEAFSFTNQRVEFFINFIDGSPILKDAGVQFTGECMGASEIEPMAPSLPSAGIPNQTPSTPNRTPSTPNQTPNRNPSTPRAPNQNPSNNDYKMPTYSPVMKAIDIDNINRIRYSGGSFQSYAKAILSALACSTFLLINN